MHTQSANSFNLSTPPPLKRLQAFREKLLTYTDDRCKFDWTWPNEPKSPPPPPPPLPPTPPMPRLRSPKLPSPLCSPPLLHHDHHHHAHQFHHHCHPMHFHEFIQPHDCISDYCDANMIQEENASQSTENAKSPSKHRHASIEHKPDIKSPTHDDASESCVKPKKKMRRAKSCPKQLFSISSKFSDNERSQNESVEMQDRRMGHEHLMPYDLEYFQSPTSIPSSQQSPHKPLSHRQHHQQHQHSRTRMIPKIRVEKAKSKTPNSMDEFLSSKLVRNNHAAKLRHKSSRQKINELAEEKLKATLHVSHFIPKCHTWNVRSTPAWKTFLSEE